jgi:hypothetical protein
VASGALLATQSAPFQVQVVPASNVITHSTVQPVFPAGPPLPVHVDLTETSSQPLANGTLTVELFDISSSQLQAPLSSASTSASVDAGATKGFDFTLATSALNPGSFLLVTRLESAITERIRVQAIAVTDHDPPVITITGVSDGEFSRLDVTPAISVVDASSFVAVITLDGQPFVSGTLVSAEAPHTLQVTAKDFFSNTSFQQVRFTIDKTPPVITMNGVVDGAIVGTPVTLTFSATDANLASVTSTLNGVPLSSGDTASTEGSYVWVVTATDKAGNTTSAQRSFKLDFTPPLVAVAGVGAGAVVNAPVTLTVSITDASPFTASVRLDGAPFVSGSTVSSEGPHTLVVSATDAAGNTASTSLSFTLDFTPPLITVSGVQGGGVYGTPRVITFSASDANPGTTSALLDGVPFLSGDVVSGEGSHLLVVSSTDAAGNSASVTVSFALDFTPPAIAISGVAQGAIVNTPVTLTFVVTDASSVSTTAMLDGAPFLSGGTVSTEGPHTLVVSAQDAAGNSGSASRSFTLDFTAPVITVTGVQNGGVYGAPRVITYSVSDANPGTTTAKLDGAAFTSGGTVSAEGNHTLVVSSTDAAGNSSTVTVPFALDFTAPVITVSGVSDGQYSSAPLSPTFSATDAHLQSVSATVDGLSFVSGNSVSAEGSHVLAVTASDAAGNTSTKTLHFTLDFTAPVITITGVADGQTAQTFTPVFSATDANPVTVSGTLDGLPFASGTTVATAGAHTLVVTATDAAGNKATATVHFTVQQTSAADPPFSFAACGVAGVTASGQAQCRGSMASSGGMTLQNQALISGGVVVGGNLALSANAVVTGSALYGGTLSISGQGAVFGPTAHIVPAPSPCTCSYDVTAQLAIAAVHNDNAVLTADPRFAPYLVSGGLEIHNNTVTLPGGTYFFSHVLLRGSAQLRAAIGATARLFVTGSFVVLNPAAVGGSTSQSGAVLVVSGASALDGGTVDLRNASDSTVRLYAPAADISFENGSQLTGAVVGRNINMQNSHRLVLDGAGDGGLPMVCP